MKSASTWCFLAMVAFVILYVAVVLAMREDRSDIPPVRPPAGCILLR